MLKVGQKIEYTGKQFPELLGKTLTIDKVQTLGASVMVQDLNGIYMLHTSNIKPIDEPGVKPIKTKPKVSETPLDEFVVGVEVKVLKSSYTENFTPECIGKIGKVIKVHKDSLHKIVFVGFGAGDEVRVFSAYELEVVQNVKPEDLGEEVKPSVKHRPNFKKSFNASFKHKTHYLKADIEPELMPSVLTSLIVNKLSLRYYYTFSDRPQYEGKWVLKDCENKQYKEISEEDARELYKWTRGFIEILGSSYKAQAVGGFKKLNISELLSSTGK